MSNVSKVLNLFMNVGENEGYVRQVVSYDNKSHLKDPQQTMAEIMNAWALSADRRILKEEDPESKLPTVTDDVWETLDETLRDEHRNQLYLWGEDTRIVQRLWYFKNNDVHAVIMKPNSL